MPLAGCITRHLTLIACTWRSSLIFPVDVPTIPCVVCQRPLPLCGDVAMVVVPAEDDALAVQRTQLDPILRLPTTPPPLASLVVAFLLDMWPTTATATATRWDDGSRLQRRRRRRRRRVARRGGQCRAGERRRTRRRRRIFRHREIRRRRRRLRWRYRERVGRCND